MARLDSIKYILRNKAILDLVYKTVGGMDTTGQKVIVAITVFFP